MRFADESIIVIRGDDGEVHAHFNVCRHRGSRICLERARGMSGAWSVLTTRGLTVSMASWLRLVRCRPDFDAGEYALHRCRVRIVEGLIFINLAPAPGGRFRSHREQPHAVYRASRSRPDQDRAPRGVSHLCANWKLAVENFRECYHCAPSHPEYAEVNAYVHAGERAPGEL